MDNLLKNKINYEHILICLSKFQILHYLKFNNLKNIFKKILKSNLIPCFEKIFAFSLQINATICLLQAFFLIYNIFL